MTRNRWDARGLTLGRRTIRLPSLSYSRTRVQRPGRPLTLSLSPSGGEGIINSRLSLAEGEGSGEGVATLGA